MWKLFHTFRSVIEQRVLALLGPAAAFFLAKNRFVNLAKRVFLSPKSGVAAHMARRKARPRAPSDAFRPILPPGEARAGNKQLKIGLPAGRGPVDWRLDDSGRVWFALCPPRRPELAGKVLELEFGL